MRNPKEQTFVRSNFLTFKKVQHFKNFVFPFLAKFENFSQK